jgi:ParB-like chromosome segregation protein Spo0J
MPEIKQLQIIPDEPLTLTAVRIPYTCIPEAQTHGSRRPSPSFVENIGRYGILSPIWICPLTEDDAAKAAQSPGAAQYRLLAGCRRVLAAREVGIMMIHAMLFPYGTTPTQAVTLMENAQRSENPLRELEQMEEILRAGGDLDDICQAIGLDRRRAESRMRLANLIPELRQALIDNKIAVGVAENAARLSVEQQKQVLADSQERGGKVYGADITDVRRAAASDAAAALPASMFGDMDAEPGVSDFAGIAERPSPEPAGAMPAITSDTGALNVARALLDYLRDAHAETAYSDNAAATAIRHVEDAVRAISFLTHPGAASVVQAAESAQEGQETAMPVIGAKGKQIKPESLRRMERRRAQKEAGKEAAAA